MKLKRKCASSCEWGKEERVDHNRDGVVGRGIVVNIVSGMRAAASWTN